MSKKPFNSLPSSCPLLPISLVSFYLSLSPSLSSPSLSPSFFLSPSRANVNIENKHGASALEVAKNWGDDFIYAVVYAKAQTLPPVVKKGEQIQYIAWQCFVHNEEEYSFPYWGIDIFLCMYIHDYCKGSTYIHTYRYCPLMTNCHM